VIGAYRVKATRWEATDPVQGEAMTAKIMRGWRPRELLPPCPWGQVL